LKIRCGGGYILELMKRNNFRCYPNYVENHGKKEEKEEHKQMKIFDFE
jgi:hypothetical protein